MRIASVLYGEILSPVVAAQTFELLRRLRARGHTVRFFVITSPRRHLKPSRWKAALGEARAAAGGALTVLTHAARHRGYGPLSRRLRKALTKFGPDVVHARQSRGGLVAGRAGVAPVLLDLRGLRPEEYLLGLGCPEEQLDRHEAAVLANLRAEDDEARGAASAVVCVSEPFRDHLGGGDDVFVIPNASESVDPAERVDLRARLGIDEGETVLVYAGSLAPWQCAAEAVDLVNRLDGCRLALLTHDEAAGRRLAAKTKRPIVSSLSPGETRSTLPAFDAGLLLRQPSIVNRVAAPLKFSEYLHAGLPVILTEGIGDASRIVREEQLGVVLPTPDDAGNADRCREGLDPQAGERGRAFARAHLTFDVTVPLYESAIEAAAGGAA